MKDNWKEIAIASEKDPKVIKILQEGPRSLGQAYLLQAMRYKYGRSDKWHMGGLRPPFFVYNNFS